MNTMKKTYLALLVIGLVIVATLGYTLMQSDKSKADEKTYKQAVEIADQVNSYFASSYVMPANFEEMGITTAPSTMRFEKVSGLEYKFCVTYKTKSSSLGYGLENTLLGFYAGSTIDQMNSSYTASALYLLPSHTKGENCLNVKPFQYGNLLNQTQTTTDPGTTSTLQ